jgi:hypothetical protein
MKFSIASHYRLNPELSPVHDDPKCFCKRFKDGEDMWEPRETEAPSNTIVVTVNETSPARDPSQSEQQPYNPPQIDTGIPMTNLFGDDE